MKKYEQVMNKYLNLLEQETNKNEKIGKHNDIPDNKFDQIQLQKGILIEREHTDDLEIAKSIAKDHLSECKIYYTLLEKLEKQCIKENQ
jgi:hypothetical protein